MSVGRKVLTPKLTCTESDVTPATTDGSTIGHLLFADPGGRAILVSPRPVSYPVSYRLQSVLNVAARLVCNSRKYNRISPLLRDLYWLRIPERIKFRLVVLVFRCHNQTAPEYLSRELQWTVEVESRRQLRSASSQRLVVRRTRLRTVGDRAFSAAAPRLWNSLPADVVASQSLATFKERLKTFLFAQSFDN